MLKKQLTRRISIIGCGLSGASIFIQIIDLLKHCDTAHVVITLYEQSGNFGPGLAYSARSKHTLCNTPISLMTVFDRKLEDFGDWLLENQSKYQIEYPEVYPLDRGAFAPRSLFGKYIQDRFLQALQTSLQLKIEVNLKAEEVLEVSQIRDVNIVKTYKESQESDHIVFCFGHHAKEHYAYLNSHPKYFSSPYPEQSVAEAFDDKDDVLVIGTSLSAIDAILILANSAHRGNIFVTSKRGKFPAVRTQFINKQIRSFNLDDLEDYDNAQPKEILLRKLKEALEDIYGMEICMEQFLRRPQDGLSVLRDDVRDALSENTQWQDLIFRLIPMLEELWYTMDESQKKDFLESDAPNIIRYVSSFPIQNAKKIMKLVEQQRIIILDDIQSIEAKDKQFTVTLKQGRQQLISGIVNATGYENNLNNVSQSLVKNLLSSNKFRLNEFGGFDVDKNSLQVSVNKDKRCGAKFYAPGSASFGTFLVTNYVPTCVRQANIIANDIVQLNG